MSPLNSWILILFIFSSIGWLMTMLYSRGQSRYVEYLEKEILETKPPF